MMHIQFRHNLLKQNAKIYSNLEIISSCSRSFHGGRIIRSNRGRLLHHEWIVDGKVMPMDHHDDHRRTVIFLHGLLGNGKNLRNPAKRLTTQFPSLKALLLDLRGHGQSSLMDINNSIISNKIHNNHHTIYDCALDIIETTAKLNLIGEQNSPVGIVGHSFGGRCALQYVHTLKFNEYNQNNHSLNNHDDNSIKSNKVIIPPKCTWLLDTVPGKAHSSVSNVIQALTNINLATIKSKQDLVTVLTSEHKIDKSIANWMTTNLRKNTETNRFEFMFDLDVAKSVLNDFSKQDFMKLIEDTTSRNSNGSRNHQNSNDSFHGSSQKVYLVMAGKNSAWTSDIVTDLQHLQQHQELELVSLPNAGHWVHVDDLDGLMNAMEECFYDISIMR